MEEKQNGEEGMVMSSQFSFQEKKAGGALPKPLGSPRGTGFPSEGPSIPVTCTCREVLLGPHL